MRVWDEDPNLDGPRGHDTVSTLVIAVVIVVGICLIWWMS